jgi:hypothetical protein
MQRCDDVAGRYDDVADGWMVDGISDNDRRQYDNIRLVISFLEDRHFTLHQLVAELEKLLDGLEAPPPDRMEALLRELDKLKGVDAAAAGGLQPDSSHDVVRDALHAINMILDPIPKLPCPCCGFRVFDRPPGSYDICPICFWEDDFFQLCNPDATCGANKTSLMDAQRNFAECGATEVRFREHVRAPTDEDIRDPGWRPLDQLHDLSRAYDDKADDEHRTLFYYWRSGQ